MTADTILAALKKRRFLFNNEAELQQAIADVLTEDGIPFEREVALAPGDRIDFLLEELGVEVKIAGNLSAVTRQLHRYARHERIKSLMLVTSRSRLANQPTHFGGKPVTVIHLSVAFA